MRSLCQASRPFARRTIQRDRQFLKAERVPRLLFFSWPSKVIADSAMWDMRTFGSRSLVRDLRPKESTRCIAEVSYHGTAHDACDQASAERVLTKSRLFAREARKATCSARRGQNPMRVAMLALGAGLAAAFETPVRRNTYAHYLTSTHLAILLALRSASSAAHQVATARRHSRALRASAAASSMARRSAALASRTAVQLQVTPNATTAAWRTAALPARRLVTSAAPRRATTRTTRRSGCECTWEITRG